MQLLPNAEPKWPSIIKRQPSRGLQLCFYSRVAVVVVSACPGYQTVALQGSNKICENASFNKTNRIGRMSSTVKFIILPAYGSDHSTVVLTSNKSPHATAVCSTRLLWVDMSTYLLSHPLRAPAQCLDEVSTTSAAKEICIFFLLPGPLCCHKHFSHWILDIERLFRIT